MCAIFYAAESGEHLGLVMPEPGKQKHPRIGSNSSKESLLLFNTFFLVCIHTGNRKWQWQLLHFLLHLSSLLFSVYIALKCSGCLEASWKQLRYKILAFWLSSGIYRIYFTVIFPLLCFIFLLILIDFSLFFPPLVLHSRVFHDRRASAASQFSAPVMQTQVQTILQNPPRCKADTIIYCITGTSVTANAKQTWPRITEMET